MTVFKESSAFLLMFLNAQLESLHCSEKQYSGEVIWGLERAREEVEQEKEA